MALHRRIAREVLHFTLPRAVFPAKVISRAALGCARRWPLSKLQKTFSQDRLESWTKQGIGSLKRENKRRCDHKRKQQKTWDRSVIVSVTAVVNKYEKCQQTCKNLRYC